MASRNATTGLFRSIPISRNPEPPAPRPRIARPPESSSRDATATAVRAGWRTYGSVTRVPSRMREVRMAVAVKLTQTSRIQR